VAAATAGWPLRAVSELFHPLPLLSNYTSTQIAFIAYSYAHGWGVPLDYREAVKWNMIAVAAGHPGAQRNLGHLYNQGFGLPRDFSEANRLFKLAADQGDNIALVRQLAA
jgi:TPR repeat protein